MQFFYQLFKQETEKMTEWEEYKLGEIVTFGNGKERPKAKGHVPVYGGNGILDYTSEYNYDGETVIIGRVGAYCGSVYYADCPIWVSDNALAVKAKNNNSPKFLYYFLRNLKLNDYAEGSSHPLVTQRLLNSIDVRFPNDVKEQITIAAILSSLDDKIDLLHRENAILEQMAETLFRQWFVVEAKEEWEEGKLGDYVVETVGGEWGKEIPEGDYTKAVQCIRGTDIADLNVGLADKTPIRFVKVSKFEKIEPRNGDIIMEISGGTENQSTGRVAYINEDVKTLFQYPIVFSNFSRLLRVNEKYTYFLYCYLKYLYDQDEFFNLENGSSGIKNLDYKALLYELTYTMPKEEELILEFNEKVSPFFNKINKNKKQIQALIQTRDGLLPRLMSGEVKI